MGPWQDSVRNTRAPREETGDLRVDSLLLRDELIEPTMILIRQRHHRSNILAVRRTVKRNALIMLPLVNERGTSSPAPGFRVVTTREADLAGDDIIRISLERMIELGGEAPMPFRDFHRQ